MHPRRIRPLVRPLALLLAGLLAGCGSSPTPLTVKPAAPVILGFVAADSTVITGASTTLTAYFSGGAGKIDSGVGPIHSGKPVQVTPTASTTYLLTVTGQGGTTTATVKVDVVAGASLTVTLAGTLPPSPAVTVLGPGGTVATIAATKTLTGLSPGTYSVEAPVVLSAGILYLPQVQGAPASLGTGGSSTITVTYGTSDSPPAISSVSDVLVMPGATKTLKFSVADGQDVPGDLAVTARSGDPAVLPDSDLALSGTSGAWTLAITAPAAAGRATVTLTVTDKAGNATFESFTVTIPTLVTSGADAGAGSLRAVLGAAAPGAAIAFDPTVTGTITLTSGPIPVKGSVRLVGPGAPALSLSGNDANAVFAVAAGGDLSVSGLMFTHAVQAIQVANGGALEVSDSAFVGDTAKSGAAISSQGRVVIRRCLFSGNTATCGTAGTCSESGAAVNQDAQGLGANATSVPDLEVFDSTFTGNVDDTGYGAGAALAIQAGTGWLSGCTISANDCHGTNCVGGAVMIVNGAAPTGWPTTEVQLDRSIVAGNTGGSSSADVLAVSGGKVDDLGDNVLGAVTGMTPVSSDAGSVSDPKLSALGDNGGPTQTMVPLPTSPALNRVPLTDLDGDLADQRGNPRRADGASVKSDAGAVDRVTGDPTQ